MIDQTNFDTDAFLLKHKIESTGQKYRDGIQFQHALDPDLPETIQSIVDGVAPDFGKIIVEFVFADIYARPGLDMKYRLIATLAAVTALNQVFAVKEYIRFSLRAGFSRTEVAEVLMQMSVYAGMGPAMDALVAAKEVFAELDAAGSATTDGGADAS